MAETSEKSGTSRARKAVRWILLLILLVVTAVGGVLYWRHAEIYPSTENAYTHANIVRVSSQVAGKVRRVLVGENDSVADGGPLFDINPAPYEAQLRADRAFFDQSAEAAGEEANALRDAANKLAEARSKLPAARDAVAAARLGEGGKPVPDADVTKAEEGWRKAIEAVEQAQAEFDKAQDEASGSSPEMSQLRSAAAALDKSENDLINTYVDAPSSGWVSGISLRPGTTVAAGHPLFAVVEPGNWWVDANFKETDLTRIRPGQEATIVLDMYPNMTIKGVVDSISAGSGATFSALPAENATGNWVKVTQRFTVRVRIPVPPEDPSRPLRVGASANVTVDTTDQDRQSAAQ